MGDLNSTESHYVFPPDNITEISTIKPEYYADHDLSYLLLPLSSLLIIAFLTVTVS